MSDDFKGRVQEERDALQHKINRLEFFFGTPAYEGLTDAERVRLRRQFRLQVHYIDILDQRLAADFQ